VPALSRQKLSELVAALKGRLALRSGRLAVPPGVKTRALASARFAASAWTRFRQIPGARHLLLVPAAWNHEFRDTRLILERDGDLQYFHLTARVQRVLTRTALSLTGAIAVTVVGLAANTVRSTVRTAELERTQEQTLQAVAELDEAAGDTVGSPSDVRRVAQRVRSRQSSLRHLLDESISTLSSENAHIWAGLQRSGINDRRFTNIQNSLPAGGPATPPSVGEYDDTSKAVVDEVIRNHELKEVLRALPGQMPLADAEVSSDFGLRRHPILGKLDEHSGLDLYSRTYDDTVRSVAPGRVKTARYSGDYGNMVLIEHAGGIQTLYGHLASIAVHEGDKVEGRAVLGRVGSTGMSTGKHLHFEVLLGGVALDPEKVVSAARNLQ
jgi:murein DD-endopeptidase MepM/ murein hydrolase activator NlpD